MITITKIIFWALMILMMVAPALAETAVYVYSAPAAEPVSSSEIMALLLGGIALLSLLIFGLGYLIYTLKNAGEAGEEDDYSRFAEHAGYSSHYERQLSDYERQLSEIMRTPNIRGSAYEPSPAPAKSDRLDSNYYY